MREHEVLSYLISRLEQEARLPTGEGVAGQHAEGPNTTPWRIVS
jgi:hypothetical protein